MSTSSMRAARSRRRGRILRETVYQGILVVFCLLVVAPCVFLLLGSLKSVEEFFSSPFGWPHSFRLSNYTEAWQQGDMATTLRNSVIVTTTAVIVSTVLCCLVSYAIARMPFRGREALRLLFVGGLVVPVQLIMIPIFVIMRQINLLGTIWPLAIVYTTFALPLGVLILVGFLRAVPQEFDEAARIDGASDLQIFLRIILPLSRPAIMAVVILNGVWIWNDFFVALMLSTQPEVTTLPLGILNFYGTYSTDWGLIFASVVMSAIPVIALYLFSTRQFIAGLTAGGIKG
jgi:raffinose/stachyose/melibiose transport system permease protein